MAKSLRSKWRRKMKQVKRVRYGQKELEQLKSIVEKAKENDAKIVSDVTMTDTSELYTVVPKPLRRSRRDQQEVEEPEEDEVEIMETDGKVKIIDPETMKDQHGNYPVWLSSHRKKKIKKSAKRISKQKRKIEKKKTKTRKNY